MCMLSCFSHVRFIAILWTVALWASLSMGFSRQEYWSGLPCPPPGNLPDPGIEPTSPALQVDFLSLSHRESPKRDHRDHQTLPFLIKNEETEAQRNGGETRLLKIKCVV